MASTNGDPVHVERVEQPAHSSAGQATQQLIQTTGSNQAAPWQHQRNGIALIILGILLTLPRVVGTGELRAGLILLTISSCFLFFAFWKHFYLLLIPGCILLGLSIGVPLAALTSGISVVWSLAFGFFGILILGRTFFNVQRSWPVYPAIPLLAVGVIIAITHLPVMLGGTSIWAALLLMAAGLAMFPRTAH